MQDFRNLKVWQKAHQLVLSVYKVTAVFPKVELFGLAAHLRKTAISVPSNLAEGCGRGSDADFGRFVQIALGSLFELDYQLLLAHDLEYIPTPEYRQLEAALTETRRMLLALRQRLDGPTA
jgi:four helix bundle protein